MNTRHNHKLLDNETRDRYARLKEWRRARALERGVESDVIIPNEALMALARKNPKTRQALAQVTALGAWKAQQYGDEILRVLNGDGLAADKKEGGL